MCGIAGIVTNDSNFDIDAVLLNASRIQKHRGPNIYLNKQYNINTWLIGFSHQRLSIIDLSDAGAQPMTSRTDSSTLIYNGEIYNYLELKEKLGQRQYASTTDTEVLLNLLEEFGIYEAVNQCNGMWAFAWLDHQNQKLYLCRDRAGVKPLYYYIHDDTLYFASEVKTIIEASGHQFHLNYQAIGEFIEQSLQDTDNNSFYSEINAVPASHFIEIDLASPTLNLKLIQYWNVFHAAPYTGNDLAAHLRNLFADAVKIRMRSDVPVGVTLSGGIDSSSIAVFMNEYLNKEQKLNVISVTSPSSDEDESKFIDIISDQLFANVHKIEVPTDPREAFELLKKSIWHNDSPVGSFSNVAHYNMMKKAHELGITVLLSGQGADELLCGYKKYVGFYFISLMRENRIFACLKTMWGFIFNRSILVDFKLTEAKRYLPNRFKPKDINILGEKLKCRYKPKDIGLKRSQTLQSRQADDLRHFSVPYLTHYEDRMSMAWSREIRLPFLDYRLMELLINLPMHHKIRNGWTKFIFRQAMDPILPSKITWRKDKKGFSLPEARWLQHELAETVLDHFNNEALIFKLNLIDRDSLLEKFRLFREKNTSKGTIWYRDIFNPLSLEIWLQINQHYIIMDKFDDLKS